MINLREIDFAICEDIRKHISFDRIEEILKTDEATSHIDRKHPKFDEYADKIVYELIESDYFGREFTIDDENSIYDLEEYTLDADLDDAFYLVMSWTRNIKGMDLVKELPSLDLQDHSEGTLIMTGDANSTIYIYGKNEEIDELVKYRDIAGTTLEEFYYLDDLEVYIGARTYCEDIETFRNRIILKNDLKDSKEGSIDCVHVAICTTTFDKYNEDFMIESSANSEIKLDISFYDHFFALKSFVQTISEFGLLKLMKQSYDYSEMNFGFNNDMHSQFIGAITSINTKKGNMIIENFMIDVLSSNPYDYATDWLMKRFDLLCERFSIIGFRILSDYKVIIYKDRKELLKEFKKELETTYIGKVTIPLEINNKMLYAFCKGNFDPKKQYLEM